MVPPSISIMIPCFNGARYLEGTILSVLEQSVPPREILVIDDGSTDGGGEIARRFPVGVHTNDRNLGLAVTRNRSLQLVEGDIVLFLDVDARADKRLVELLQLEFSDSSTVAVGGQGIEVNILNAYDEFRRRFFSQTLGSRRRAIAPVLFGLCSAYRRDVLIQLGGFDPDFRTNGEDFDLSFRLKKNGHRLVYNPELKVYHHRHDDGASFFALVYRWFYWGGRAFQKNGRVFLIPFLAKIALDLLKHIVYSVFIKKSLLCTSISLKILRQRCRAVWDLCFRRLGAHKNSVQQ